MGLFLHGRRRRRHAPDIGKAHFLDFLFGVRPAEKKARGFWLVMVRGGRLCARGRAEGNLGFIWLGGVGRLSWDGRGVGPAPREGGNGEGGNADNPGEARSASFRIKRFFFLASPPPLNQRPVGDVSLSCDEIGCSNAGCGRPPSNKPIVRRRQIIRRQTSVLRPSQWPVKFAPPSLTSMNRLFLMEPQRTRRNTKRTFCCVSAFHAPVSFQLNGDPADRPLKRLSPCGIVLRDRRRLVDANVRPLVEPKGEAARFGRSCPRRPSCR